MSKATDNVETIRDSWGSDNDGEGSGMDSDLLDGLAKEALPVSTPTQTALDSKPTGTWELIGTTLYITIPTP